MNKDLLDDFDWSEEDFTNEDIDFAIHNDPESVVMLQTFNTNEAAQVCAAALKSENIDAHIISSTTGDMTPFAYGNIRLFVAASQKEQAQKIIKQLTATQDVYEDTNGSATRIFILLLIGLFIIGFVIYFLQGLIYG